jgi:hypothetical protein
MMPLFIEKDRIKSTSVTEPYDGARQLGSVSILSTELPVEFSRIESKSTAMFERCEMSSICAGDHRTRERALTGRFCVTIAANHNKRKMPCGSVG